MLLTNRVVYMCQVSKLQRIYAMGLTLLSALKTTNTPGYIKFKSKISKKSNSNLGGLSRGSF